MSEQESSDRNTERERVYERDPDPGAAADRPLEPRSSDEPLHDADVPHPDEQAGNPHHRLNTPVGEVDPTADSDPYRPDTAEDDADTASGVSGEGQDAEDR